jgi:hypothetical protein
MKLPTIKLNKKVFIWDSRLREFRPEIVDMDWCSLPVTHTLAEIMDSAVFKNDLKMQRLVLLDCLDMNDARGMIEDIKSIGGKNETNREFKDK